MKRICLMKKECAAPLRWGACNESSTSPESRCYSCRSGIDSRSPPSLDPYVPANDRPRKAAGVGRDCGIAALYVAEIEQLAVVLDEWRWHRATVPAGSRTNGRDW